MVVACTHGPRAKVSLNWVGPRRIVTILSEFTVKVEPLLTKEVQVIHVCRVKPYVDSLVGHRVEMEEIANFSDRIWFIVDTVKDIRQGFYSIEVLISWMGLKKSSESWESLSIMFKDLPTKVKEFLNKKRNTVLSRKARNSLGI